MADCIRFSRLGVVASLVAALALTTHAQDPVSNGPYNAESNGAHERRSLSVLHAPRPICRATQPRNILGAGLAHGLFRWDNIQKNIRDYTCILVKRERINGTLGDYQYLSVKIRNHPFSVYLRFLKPDEIAGREVIYQEGANKGELQAHEGKGLRAKLGTFSFNPTSAIAMEGNRYPITQIGIANLTHRLIEVAEHDKNYGECEVQFRKGRR